MIILGIDPGTATVGYGIIATAKPKHQLQDRNEKPKVIDFGCVVTSSSSPMGERLEVIYEQICSLLKKHKPDVVSVENLFFFKNAKTAMPVSQARGVILLAAAHHRIPTLEFTPLQMKMTMVGYGKASKLQVQGMTKQLLDMGTLNATKNRRKDDAFDALGIALCAFFKHSVR